MESVISEKQDLQDQPVSWPVLCPSMRQSGEAGHAGVSGIVGRSTCDVAAVILFYKMALSFRGENIYR